MEYISVVCDKCKAAFKASKLDSGREACCPQCTNIFILQAVSVDEEPTQTIDRNMIINSAALPAQEVSRPKPAIRTPAAPKADLPVKMCLATSPVSSPPAGSIPKIPRPASEPDVQQTKKQRWLHDAGSLRDWSSILGDLIVVSNLLAVAGGFLLCVNASWIFGARVLFHQGYLEA